MSDETRQSLPDHSARRDEDDFSHYFNATSRLSAENAALRAENEALKAEVERLREAIEGHRQAIVTAGMVSVIDDDSAAAAEAKNAADERLWAHVALDEQEATG